MKEIPEGYKQCGGKSKHPTCGEVKPISEFPKHGNMCKKCISAKSIAWQKANPERTKQKMREWYQRPENSEKVKAKQKERYRRDPKAHYESCEARRKANPERYAERRREWESKNREVINEYKNRWRRDNLETARVSSRRNQGKRRARMRESRWEDVDYSEIFDRDQGICHICKTEVEPDNWHADHLIPIARGGSHTYDNVFVSHPFCNLSKGVKMLKT